MPIWDRFRSGRLSSRRLKAARARRRRQLAHESLETRELLAFGDVVIDFKYLNSAGTPVTSLQVGQDFTLQANVRDGQAVPEGVLRAYFDLTYPAARVSVQGPITHGPNYNISTSGDASTPGLIDEVGGLDTDAFPPSSPGDSFLLFSLPMRATSAGTFTLTADPADGPTRDIRLFDFTEVPLNDVRFVTPSIQIVGAGINVTPTSGLTTTELGGTAPFSIVLTSQPTANVTINLSSSDTTEGTVSPTSVTFTTANWNTPRTITVTGVNDAVDDGDVQYTIVTAPAISTDPTFNGINPSDVTVTNANDDTAEIVVTATTPLMTSETGTTATFQLVLRSQPTANVTIPISSSDTTEGTVSVASVVFTPQNWNVSRTITVTGVDDPIADGNINYTIILGAATSSDPKYSGLNPADLPAINSDAGDTPGFTIQPSTGLVTTEAGGTATFQVRLNTQPAANVNLGLSSSDTTEGTVSPSSLTFTTANWNVFQTVTITGVDDNVADGNVAYTIITATATGAAGYAGLNPIDVSVSNTDNDPVGFIISPTSGLVTSEAGQAATFNVRLTSQPTANVTIPLSTSDATEGTVSPASVTFTPQNWNVNRLITVTGVDDDLADGTILYQIITGAAVSSDAAYNGLNPVDVSATNTDNDPAAFEITPTAGLTTTEAGGTAQFTVRLRARPSANVVLGLSSSDLTEGTVSPSSLTFTNANWNVLQTVTVTGVNDNVSDGNIAYTIVTAAATSADAAYNGVNPTDVSITNTDDDPVGITVTPTTGLTTTEAGGTATFTIRLLSQPTANVTIPLSSNATAEGTVSPTSVTFTPQNWNQTQAVTVRGVDEFRDDGDIQYSIVTGLAVSSDPKYNGLNAVDVSVTNIDDDTAGITVTAPAKLTTSESGTSATFQIVLDSEPTANVTIPVSSSDTTEGSVSPSSVTFTPQNWNVARTITVTGVDDDLFDGDVDYSIILGAATSGDLAYNGINPPDRPAVNQDAGETPGFFINPTAGLTTTETGGTATFQIRLTSQPTTNVNLGLSSSDTTEGTVSPSSVTFTPANWNVLQTVTVTGVDDDVADGNVMYSIITAAATGDAGYVGLNPIDVSVTNLNVGDVAGFTIAPAAGLVTSEAGQTATFNIRLSSQPTANVTLPISTSDATEGTVSPTSVTFTPQNWNVNQPITVTGVNDDIDDDSVAYEIVTGTAVSSDVSYSGLNPINVAVSNSDDNDTASIVASPTAGLTTTEVGGAMPFTIKLGSQPTANVQIQLASSDVTEGTVSPAMLTFTPANWNVNQTATVTGVNDDVQDGPIAYMVIATATSTDATYNGLAPRSVSVTNSDDDIVGILVDPIAGLVTTEAGGTAQFTIRLRSEPTANVTIPLTSSNTAEGTVSPASLTFTNQNWNVPQNVTVTGVSDFRADGDIAYQILTAPATSTDTNYNGVNAADVAVTNVNTGPIAGFNINPTSGLTVSEDGTTSATFQISLNSQPAAEVLVTFSSSDLTEGTVSSVPIAFNDQNWNVPQTVTINGVDDEQADGDVSFAVTAMVASQDPAYSELIPPAVAVTNIDDDPTAVNVSPTAGLTTSESGTTATFTVRLASQPTADVTIGLASSNTSEGIVSPTSVTFTVDNWDLAQSVMVTGVDDETVDGVRPFMILTAPAVSADVNYDAFDAPDVSITNLDDDSATLTLSSMSPSQAEGTGGGVTEFVFQLELSRAVAGGFNVGYTTNDGTATAADGDYVDNDGVLTFEGAKCEIRTITVQANQDNKVEADETFEVAIGQLTNIAPNLAERITFTTSRATATIVNDDTATLLLSPVSTALPEGTGPATTLFTFEVRLSAPVQGGLNIAYTTDDATATTADGDYLDNDATLSFTGAADERHTITVVVNQDGRVEADETLTVTLRELSNLDPSVIDSISIDGSPATATIVNDDTAELTITSVTSSQTEGSDGSTTDYTFEVALSNTVQGGFDIAYSTDDNTATLANEDYIDNDGVLTFLGTANEVQAIMVRVKHDLLIEPDELFQVALGQLSGTSATIAESVSINGSPATATILNDDVPRLVLAAVTPALMEGTNGDGALFTFTITLSDDIDDPDGFDVAFATSDGTATVAAGDYTATSGEVHFAGTAGEMHNITVEVFADSMVEANETFRFALGDVTGLEPGITINRTGTPTTATILNDDTTTISISPLNVSADEGTEGTGVEHAFVVTLSNPVQGGLHVDYATVDGTATVADGDYVSNTGTLAFNGDANETQSVTVIVNADAQVEADETLQLMLGAVDVSDAEIASSISLGNPALLTINNDDTAMLTLTPVTSSQLEGTGGTVTEFTFQVTLSNGVQGGFAVAYATNDGSATLADADYLDNDGMLTFNGDENETKTITVQVNHDQQIEPSESFNVSLGALSQLNQIAGDAITIGGSPATVTILNDDFPRLVVSVDATSQNEGNASGNTEFVFTVTLSDAVADADGFDVAYATSDGTATAASGDYSGSDGVLHFNGTAGESQTVVVQVHRDEIVEADETFSFSLVEITGLADGEMIVFENSPLTVSIVNDDAATISLTPGLVSRSEGSSGATTDFTFNVTLSNAVQGGFSINYATTDGSATAASGDYVDNDGTLSFSGNAGEMQTITVRVNHDNRVELDETFQVTLGALSLVANDLATSITVDEVAETATILNDDTAMLTISAAVTVMEGTGTGTSDVAFEVTLSNPVQGGFRIGYATNDGSATVANADYVDNDGSLTFTGAANETKTVIVQVRRDSLVERNETFSFGLTQFTEIDATLAQSISVDATPREVTILNDDLATVSFVSGTSSVAEANGTHTVDVILNVDNSGSLSEAIVVNIAALPTGTAMTPGDFTLNTASVMFEAGSQNGTRRTITLTLQPDGLTEDAETINLQLSFNGQNLGGAVTTGLANHVVTITDDPMTAAIRGTVWADTNNNGRIDDSEMMIPGVTVRLSGQDLRGQVIEISTMTAADGSYLFDRLPAGTYRVTEVQSDAFHDGQEVLGTVAGSSVGQIASDEFRNIVLAPSQQAIGYNFAEVSLKAQYVTNRYFLASTPQRASMLRGFVADAASRAGNEMQSVAIRNGESVEVRRIGPQVTVLGTSQRDVVTFTPAQPNSGGEHTLVANGIRWTFSPAAVNDFVFIGGGGNDFLRLDDSPASEQLSATRDTAFVIAEDYRAEATAFELVQAISDSGGQDVAMNLAQAVDFVLQLDGNWTMP